MKEIAVDMILNVPEGVTGEEVRSKFIQFASSNGWLTGGSVRELTEADADDTII